jgi:serine/threonine protein kinase
LGTYADTFVLKTYNTSEAENHYNAECAAFRHLKPNPSIIGFHGSFIRGDTYNILLEYADKGTLEDYFEKEVPPTEGEEIIEFWASLFSILHALYQIQNVIPEGGDSPRIFEGYVALLGRLGCLADRVILQTSPRCETREHLGGEQWL